MRSGYLRERLRALPRSSEATAAIEFAFLCIPLFVAIFGFIMFGYVLHARSELQAAVDAGTRLAFIRGEADLDAIERAVTERFGEKAGELSVSAVSADADDGRRVVTVSAEWTFEFGADILNLPGDFAIERSGAVEVRG